MKTNWFDRQKFNYEIKYPETPGYSGPVPVYICGYKGFYIDKCKPIIPKLKELSYEICVICKNSFEKVKNTKTCSDECSKLLKIQQKKAYNDLRKKNVDKVKPLNMTKMNFEIDDFVEIIDGKNIGEFGTIYEIQQPSLLTKFAVKNIAGHRGWFDSNQIRLVILGAKEG